MQTFKPAHVAITRYFRALDAYAKQGVRHEGALRTAFQDLLADTALSVGWQLIPELTDRIKHIRPDGTLRDSYFIERGHWEAKDSDDNLETEIKKKIRSDYPLKNIIFEDTQRAVLYQNGKRIGDYSLGDRTALASLLNAFYGHIEPAHETFEKAIEEFKDRVPALAKNLLSRIRSARHNDPPFAEAFEVFLRLCRGLPQNLWAERRTGSPSSDPQRARVLARPRCVGLTAWTPAPRTRAGLLWFSLKEVWVG